MSRSSESSDSDSDTGNKEVYLDYNSTTPLATEVREKMKKVLKDGWGNPSSSHTIGVRAKNYIKESRKYVAEVVGAKNEDDIIFTSGGTEANNMAIVSAVTQRTDIGQGKPHVITSSVEHDSIMKCLKDLEKRDIIEFSIVKIHPFTALNVFNDVVSLVKDSTCLVTIMHANNETGQIFPIQDLGRKLSVLNEDRYIKGLPRIFFHSDAAQTIGKVVVDVASQGLDYVTIVGHKFYGPRIGALFVNKSSRVPVVPLLHGGGQEQNLRPGTENSVMIAGLGTACKLIVENDRLSEYQRHMKKMRSELEEGLLEAISGIKVNFGEEQYHTVKNWPSIPYETRLPNTLSVAVPQGNTGADILNKCKGSLCASLGAACHSFVETPSKILLASGLTQDEARRTIRLSVGRDTTSKDIKIAIEALSLACASASASTQ